MKKMTLLSLVAVTLVFTACGEDTKAHEQAVKAKAERAVELKKMAEDKMAAKAAEKAEVAQIRATEKAAAKVKAEKEAAEAKLRLEQEAVEAAEKEAEAKAASEKVLKETNTTQKPVTDADIIEAVKQEVKVTH